MKLSFDTVQSDKARQILHTAFELFLKHGIRRVSIEEICREANVSKVTFYKYFDNKIHLVKFLLEQFFAEEMQKYRLIMAQPRPFSEKVRDLIKLKDEETRLMSREFFVDLWKNAEPELRETMKLMQQQSQQEALQDLKAVQEKGEIRRNIKPEFILYLLDKINQMAQDEALQNLYGSLNELTMELTNFFFYGIMPNKEMRDG